MKAWVLHKPGDLRLQTVEAPLAGKGEVIINVKAAGICGSDIPRIYRTGAHVHPLIPGHEFSGVVQAVGEGAADEWLNKRVGVFPLIPCKKCLPCQRQQYEMCQNYSYLGSRRDGGFAEYVSVPEENLIELPDDVSFQEAAMLEPMAVSVHAMRRVSPAVSETVVVCGLGTIGMLLLMFLMDAGIKHILAVGNKESQRKQAVKMGLPDSCYCNSSAKDVGEWIKNHTNGAGADVFFECVGRNETISQAVDFTAAAGRVCLVGNPYSDMKLDQATYWKILRNQLVVTGTWNSSFTGETDDDWHYVLQRLAGHRIAPAEMISHFMSRENLEDGLEIMRDKTEEYCKIMIFES